MLPAGRIRYIDFALADAASNPVAGRTLDNWGNAPNKLIFLRDTQPCQDPLALKDYGDGRYTISYSPSSAGHDYIQVYDQSCDIRIIDVEDIVPADFAMGGSSVFSLDHNWGGTDVLKVAASGPQDYILYVFEAAGWDRGSRSSADARGATPLDADGRWINSVKVPSGVYDIVLIKPGTTQVIKYNLGVG